jgi:hypothetical protein
VAYVLDWYLLPTGKKWAEAIRHKTPHQIGYSCTAFLPVDRTLHVEENVIADHANSLSRFPTAVCELGWIYHLDDSARAQQRYDLHNVTIVPSAQTIRVLVLTKHEYS